MRNYPKTMSGGCACCTYRGHKVCKPGCSCICHEPAQPHPPTDREQRLDRLLRLVLQQAGGRAHVNRCPFYDYPQVGARLVGCPGCDAEAALSPDGQDAGKGGHDDPA